VSLTARSLRVTIAGHEVAAMPSGPDERYDFFLSRRGSVATIAQEVTDVLKDNGYRVFTQDYDIPLTANFIENPLRCNKLSMRSWNRARVLWGASADYSWRRWFLGGERRLNRPAHV
jgi:hypothetical protein